MPKQYPTEFKERAVRMVREHQAEYGSVTKTSEVVGQRVGVSRETLRRWVTQQDVDNGKHQAARPGRRGRTFAVDRAHARTGPETTPSSSRCWTPSTSPAVVQDGSAAAGTASWRTRPTPIPKPGACCRRGHRRGDAGTLEPRSDQQARRAGQRLWRWPSLLLRSRTVQGPQRRRVLLQSAQSVAGHRQPAMTRKPRTTGVASFSPHSSSGHARDPGNTA
jgi:transposase-like protein